MIRLAGLAVIVGCMAGCFSDDDGPEKEELRLACDVSQAQVSFEDVNAEPGRLSGSIELRGESLSCNANRFIGQWLSDDGAVAGSVFELDKALFRPRQLSIELPHNIALPQNATQLSLTPAFNDQTAAAVTVVISDYTGMVKITGPGGNWITPWYYGEDRPALNVKSEKRDGVEYCRFDNGRVLVHDTNYQSYDSNDKTVADDLLFPAYEFDCTESKENLHRPVYQFDGQGNEVVQTYSVINDAYFYGDVSFTMFEKYFGVRPLDKLRLRMHYGPEIAFGFIAHWDGAYVNLNDVLYQAYGAASLDIVAHEAAHGVLQNQTALKHASEVEYTADGRTLHEAYADVAAVMAHYLLHDELNWINGDENYSARKRYLDQIETEQGAILSYLDYSEAGTNYYKRMGMLTYPFYLLTEKWGIHTAFELYTDAAKSCWEPNSTLEQAAACIKVRADLRQLNTQDVVDAFRTVKIKLAEEDTFSHFKVEQRKLRAQFTDLSQTDRTIVAYHWDFGDGNSSTEPSPYYEYTHNGEYEAKLTVEDHTGTTDEFARTILINDQYCAINETPSEWEISTVEINGETVAFSKGRSDYTDTLINVNAGENISIKIDGQINDPEKERTLWYVWVDLNDDAEFASRNYHEEENNEQRLREENQNGEFALNDTFSIPEKYKGETLYMRVASDTNGFPCYAGVGGAFDIRLQIN